MGRYENCFDICFALCRFSSLVSNFYNIVRLLDFILKLNYFLLKTELIIPFNLLLLFIIVVEFFSNIFQLIAYLPQLHHNNCA